MLRPIIYSILSGILLAIAYPALNLEFPAFFAFVPLFFAVRGLSAPRAFFVSYICGLVFFAITICWLIHVTLLGLILLVLYLGVYFGLFGFFIKLAVKDQRSTVIIIPLAWVFLEYARSAVLTGFPWALLGYSQYLNIPFIQISDLTGVWGVSFLVMMINCAIYDAIRRIGRGVLLTVVAASLSLTYGYYRIYPAPARGEIQPIKVSVLQGNIPQYQKWDEEYAESIMDRYEMLTREAAKDKPDLIIWPETSVPGSISEEPELLDRALTLAKSAGTPILIGTVTGKRPYYNSAVLISAEGKIIGQYDKLHLVPFGEYVPLEQYFPFLRDLIGVPIGDFTPGKKYTVFKQDVVVANFKPAATAKAAAFAVLICFEDIIPSLSRRFVREGADFLVNITNDAWFMDSSEPYQHAAASVFRAVENRRPVVRAANTGPSCFIDRYGRIYDKVSVDKKDAFVIGYKTGEVRVKGKR